MSDATGIYSLQYILEREKGEHNVLAHNLRAILMVDGFVFDPVAHSVLADVSASEIGTGFGYTVGGVLLTNVSVAQITAQNKVLISCDNAEWTAAGGDIPTIGAAVILNDSHVNKTLVAGYNFAFPYTPLDSTIFRLNLSTGALETYAILP